MRKIKGVIEVHIGKSGLNIKKVKAILEEISRQITSLTIAKLIITNLQSISLWFIFRSTQCHKYDEKVAKLQPLL